MPPRDEAIKRARFLILECASEDCYGLKEFIGNLAELFPAEDFASQLAVIKTILGELSMRELIRLHWGPQCAGDAHAGAELTIAPAQLDEISEDACLAYHEPSVCVCDTPQTKGAFNDAWRDTHS
jgi:hypothetical protein